MVSTFCKPLLFKMKGWCGLERDSEMRRQMGKSYYQSRANSKLSKGGACSPKYKALGNGPVTCRHSKDWIACTGCWCPDFCILASCVMRHTCILTEILSTVHITGCFLHSFDMTYYILNCKLLDQNCFVFFSGSNTLLIPFQSFIYCALLIFEW